MAKRKENPTQPKVIIGDDGYPIPQTTLKAQEKFICICPICIGANARMSVAKTGNWIVRCASCSIILYLNDITSMNLFRGLQSFLEADPQHQVTHTTGIIQHAPDEGT